MIYSVVGVYQQFRGTDYLYLLYMYIPLEISSYLLNYAVS
jgi:hypothetical protein